MSHIILFNKPYRVLSQFSPNGDKKTLSDFIHMKGVYPAGRLDYDSEGLMILTDDGQLQATICDPKNSQYKTYLVQVEGQADRKAITRLKRGIDLKEGRTLPARVKTIPPPKNIWPRTPPIRVRRLIPDSWLEIQIRQGINRQIRRMTAAVGLPTLRLIRTKVNDWELNNLNPGEYLLLQDQE